MQGPSIIRYCVTNSSTKNRPLHLMRLSDGGFRIVVITPKKDGIDEHLVYEVTPETVIELMSDTAPFKLTKEISK